MQVALQSIKGTPLLFTLTPEESRGACFTEPRAAAGAEFTQPARGARRAAKRALFPRHRATSFCLQTAGGGRWGGA